MGLILTAPVVATTAWIFDIFGIEEIGLAGISRWKYRV